MTKVVTLLTALFWFVACVPNQNTYVVDLDDTPEGEKLEIRYPNQDTLQLRSISVFARYTPVFTEDSICLELKISEPDGGYIADSIVLPTPARGQDYSESKLLHLDKSNFRNIGDYTFTFTPLTKNTKGITALGIIID